MAAADTVAEVVEVVDTAAGEEADTVLRLRMALLPPAQATPWPLPKACTLRSRTAVAIPPSSNSQDMVVPRRVCWIP